MAFLKRLFAVCAVALLCAPLLARAAEKELARKEARLKQAAELLQQISDEDYLQVAKGLPAKPAAGNGRVPASRSEALAAVYDSLAALAYRQALQTGPAPEARAQVEASLQARLKDADSVAVNPETLEEAGWWGSLVQGLGEGSGDSPSYSYRPPAVAAVRGGRDLPAEADPKAAQLRRSLQEIEQRLRQPALEAGGQAALHYERGKLYEALADRAATGAPGKAEAPEKAADAAQAEDPLKRDIGEMDKLEKKMRGEVERRRERLDAKQP